MTEDNLSKCRAILIAAFAIIHAIMLHMHERRTKESHQVSAKYHPIPRITKLELQNIELT